MDNTTAPQFLQFARSELQYTPFGVKWLGNSKSVIVVGTSYKQKDTADIFDLADTGLKKSSELSTGEGKGIRCVEYQDDIHSSGSIVFGGCDGSVSIHDPNYLDISHWKVQAHISQTGALAVCPSSEFNGAELASGGYDGIVKLWDPRTNVPVVTIQPVSGAKVECWSLAFGNTSSEDRCLVAGYDNGDAKILDLKTMKISWTSNQNNGICSVYFDKSINKPRTLFLSGLESSLTFIDLREDDPSDYLQSCETYWNTTIWSAITLPQNSLILSLAGGNGKLGLAKYTPSIGTSRNGPVGKTELLAEHQISTQPIVSLDWHTEKLGLLATAALDQALSAYIVTRLDLY